MREATARRVAWSVGLVSIAMMLATLVIKFMDRGAILPETGDSWDPTNVFDTVVNIAVPVLGIVIASRRRENPIGWLFLLAGLTLGTAGLARAYGLHALVADPGSLPAGRAIGWLSNWTWPIPICLLAFLLLLFPTGRLPSRRWRPVGWLAGAVLVLWTVTAFVFAVSNWSDPFGGPRTEEVGSFLRFTSFTFMTAVLALPVAMVGAFVSVVVRFRHAEGEERLQLKWFATAAAILVVTFIPTFFLNSPLAQVFFDLALLFLYAAIGIAILKYRLYDIDVIINRAVVYGGLAVFITVVYVFVVAVVGGFIGATELLSLVATAIVAVAFQPVRHRVQGVARRLVYGERATPYETLANFSERLAETYATDDVLPRMARILAEGTGASRAEVWLRVGSELRPAASWPRDGGTPSPVPLRGGGHARIVEASRVTAAGREVEVRHQGELLGALAVIKPPNEPFTPAEEKLLSDLASQAGLVLRNVALIADLRASRQRLVAAQDAERRRLERNLHDGAQQQLVALAVKQRLARDLVSRDPERAAAMLADLESDTSDALENLRDLARGIYPPLLADKGLGPALDAQARKAPVPVVVEVDGVGRYRQDVEAAVYFSCLEAMQNVAKYADATRACITLMVEEGDLRFSVEDDGVGFDPSAIVYGTGLQGMADRLDAIGGTLEVRSAPGEGTAIRGRIPAPASVPES